MKDRIKQYMDHKGISAGELSSQLEVQRSNISHILNGRNKPGASFIEKLLVIFPDLNARWLLTGAGEMVEIPVKDMQSAAPQQNVTKGIEETKKDVLQTSLFSDTKVNAESKPIDKVILLFSDGTFTDFKRK